MAVNRNAMPMALALLIGLQCWAPALAVRAGVRLDSQSSDTAEDRPGYVVIGHIPASSETLSILTENANVRITRSGKASDIVVSTNQPRNWNISGSTVRQAAMLNSHGVAMLSDKLGSRCIADGKVYLLPPGPIQGGISLSKDGVMVAGKKLEPLAGSDVPGIGSGQSMSESASGPAGKLKGRVVLPDDGQVGSGDAAAATDRLDVLVPQNYRGNLKIGAAGGSEVELGTWSGGTLETYLLGRGLFTADTLDSLAKAVVDVSGDGTVQIKALTTATFVANVNGKGKISVGNGHAEVSNATISGDGSIVLKGNYKNLKQAVQGQGTISVTD